MWADAAIFANLFFAGLLAGEEFTIRHGLRAPLARLEQVPHIRLRQALIRRLRILVPALFALTLASSGAAVWLGGPVLPTMLPTALRAAGIAVLIGFILVTLLGTVPINQAVLAWDPSAPPPAWRDAVARWERLDNIRAWAALAAFVLFLTALAVR